MRRTCCRGCGSSRCRGWAAGCGPPELGMKILSMNWGHEDPVEAASVTFVGPKPKCEAMLWVWSGEGGPQVYSRAAGVLLRSRLDS
eukprot:337377-Chlamydomonas_euryale.AAC.1